MEDETICRVCRSEGTVDNPLFYPCKCSGSIKYIHQECLEQWLQHSKKRYCELCNHSFAFTPVYDEAMPQTLPSSVFLAGAIQKMIAFSKQLLRHMLVFICWFLVVPFFTTQVWHLYFGVQASEDGFLPLEAKAVISDCIKGAFISSTVIVTFLGLMGLRDYLVAHSLLREQMARPVRQPEPAVPQAVGIDPAEDFMGGDLPVEFQEGGGAVDAHHQGPLPNFAPPLVDEGFQNPAPNPDREEVADGNGAAGGGGGANLAAAFLDGPQEEVSFEELIGLKGPILHLFENIFWVLLFNAVFLGAFVVIPYVAGKLLFYQILSSGKSLEFLQSAMKEAIPPEFPLAPSLNFTLTALSNFTLTTADPPTSLELLTERTISIVAGYMLVSAFIILYLTASAIFRSQELPFHQFLQQATHFFFIFFKVSLLLSLELILFPLACGWVIYFSSVDLFDTTFSNHLSLVYDAPMTLTFVQWLIGMGYMVHLSLFASVLRGVLRPGVLWFLRSPNDPSFQPVREMIEIPLKRHFRRLFFSAIIYHSILLLLVYGVIKLTKWFMPSFFPLNLDLSDSLLEVPLDFLAFHVALPFTFDRLSPSELIEKSLRVWFRLVSRVLCLSSFLLGKDYRDEVIPGTILVAARNNDVVDQFNEHEPADNAQNMTMVFRPPHFRLRIATVIALLAATATISVVFLVFLPVLVGRYTFGLLVPQPLNDAYSFGVGLWILCVALGCLAWLKDVFREATTSLEALQQTALMISRLCFLFVFAGGLIPLLAGVLFQLVITNPLLSSWDQCSVFFFFQDWILGGFFAKLAYNAVIHGRDSPWKAALLEASQAGLAGADIKKVSMKVLFPITGLLIGAIMVPQVLLTLVRFTGLVGHETALIAYHYSYFALALLTAIALPVRSIVIWLRDFRDSIRDERYLVGQRLHNLDPADQPSTSSLSSAVGAS